MMRARSGGRRVVAIAAAVWLGAALPAGAWLTAIDGDVPGGSDAAAAVAVDPANDVVAVGRTSAEAGDTFAVVKYRGTDGGIVWRRAIVGSGDGTGHANAVAVDGTGAVIAAGVLNDAGSVDVGGTEGLEHVAQAARVVVHRTDPGRLEQLRKGPLDDEAVLEDVRHAGWAAQIVFQDVELSVAVVVSGTPDREVSPPRRLGKLPYFREIDMAFGRAGRTLREHASRRRRTGVVRHPIHDLPSSRILADVFSRDHGHSATLVCRNA
jgi:hypothetical protein